MDGAQNVTIPNQTHVQTCTSAQSFVEYYKFLTGRRPGSDISPAERVDTDRRQGPQLPREPRGVGRNRSDLAAERRRPADEHHTGRVSRGHGRLDGWRCLGSGHGPGGQALRVRARAPGAADAPHLLRAVREERLHAPPAPVAGDRAVCRQPPRQHGRSEHQVQGAVGRPGRRERPAARQRHQHLHCGPVSDQQAGQRVLRVRPQPRRPDRSELAGSRAQRAAVHPGRRRLYAAPARRPDGTISFQLVSRGVGPVRTLNVPNWDSATDGFTIQWNDFE